MEDSGPLHRTRYPFVLSDKRSLYLLRQEVKTIQGDAACLGAHCAHEYEYVCSDLPGSGLSRPILLDCEGSELLTLGLLDQGAAIQVCSKGYCTGSRLA